MLPDHAAAACAAAGTPTGCVQSHGGGRFQDVATEEHITARCASCAFTLAVGPVAGHTLSQPLLEVSRCLGSRVEITLRGGTPAALEKCSLAFGLHSFGHDFEL